MDSIYSELFNFDLDKPSCSLNVDNLKCENFDKIINSNIIKKLEDNKHILKKQIDTLDEIEQNKKNLKRN